MRPVLFFRCLSSSVLLMLLIPAAGRAQSISPGLSDPIAQESATSGLTSSLSGDDVTGNDLHDDVSDPTHSQLLGSALTPSDYAYSSSQTVSTPMSGITSDSQSTIGMNDFPGGRVRSQSFLPGSSSSAASSSMSRQDPNQALGTGSLAGAFSGGASRSAFAGISTRLSNTGQGFSGQGVTAPITTTGVGATQTLVQMSQTDEVQGFIATDPALTQQAESSPIGLQLGTFMPSPSLESNSLFFDDGAVQPERYEYDDGQTPPSVSSVAPKVGTILGAAPEYLVSTTGFPDSTKGTAALPSEASNSLSGVSPIRDMNSSPFAPVSEGTVYGAKFGLNPSLKDLSPAPQIIPFRAIERRAQAERIRHGMSITESNAIYQDDLRQYQRYGKRGKRQSTIHEGENANQVPVFQSTFHKEIR